MITRRNIRIKVMQLLYSIEATNDTNAFKNPIQTLDKNFQKTRELFVFLLANLYAVAQYAERDSRNRAAKHVPTEADLNVNTKISGNNVLWQSLEDHSYKNALDEFKTELHLDYDVIKRLYEALVETNEYKLYILQESRENREDKKILSFIFNTLMLPNDVFESYCEDRFGNWEDDIEMLHSLVNSYLNKPHSLDAKVMLDDDKWSFAKSLLTTVQEKSEHLITIASPKFKGWDVDRIASIDIVIIKLGLSELLYFETIPTKVTINEYIDIAKEYSTPQSGQFINGILDALHKELLAANKIVKVDFRKNK